MSDEPMEDIQERYPEHMRLAAIQPESQAIGEFLANGLREQGLVLAERGEHGRLHLATRTIQGILATYFQIDLTRLEQEKLDMIEQIRRSNADQDRS